MSLNKLLLPQETHAICLGDRWFQGFYFMDIYTACLGHFRVPKTITSYLQLRTWPRFETEVWSNSQMANWIRLLHMNTYVTIYCSICAFINAKKTRPILTVYYHSYGTLSSFASEMAF